MASKTLTGLTATMMVMARNANGGEVHVAWAKEKAAVVRLEKLGLVVVRRTTDKIAGMTEWYYRAVEVAS